MSGSSSVAVYRPACPVYQVTCTRDVAVLAGGGGAGNFGVPNVLAIVEANPSGIRTVSEYKTDKGAFNNAAIHAETNSIVGSIDGETLSFTLSSTDHSLSEPKTHTTDDRSKAEVCCSCLSWNTKPFFAHMLSCMFVRFVQSGSVFLI
eukprot:m.48659 g.48659  ORF g.48659 m.48659 type:complete len:148 (-) comp11052_c1_seq2:1028-1471(-)